MTNFGLKLFSDLTFLPTRLLLSARGSGNHASVHTESGVRRSRNLGGLVSPGNGNSFAEEFLYMSRHWLHDGSFKKISVKRRRRRKLVLKLGETIPTGVLPGPSWPALGVTAWPVSAAQEALFLVAAPPQRGPMPAGSGWVVQSRHHLARPLRGVLLEKS